MSNIKTVVSAGLLISDGAKFLLVKPDNTDRKNWGIPKGKRDPGEALRSTALREVYEETGWKGLPSTASVDAVPFFHYEFETKDRTLGKVHKHVFVYWCKVHNLQDYKFECKSFLSDGTPEITQFRWCTLDEALELTAKTQKDLFHHLKMLRDLGNVC